MTILSIDGYDYTNLPIIDYEISLQPLDGEATGRTKAAGWELIRETQGVIINLKLQFAATDSQDPDFVQLYRACKSMGSTEFVRVRFIDPVGDTIEQDMYIGPTTWKNRRIEKNGIVYTDVINTSFIARRGFV